MGLEDRVCSQITLCLSKFISACVPQMFYCKSGIDHCASQSLNCEEIFFVCGLPSESGFLFLSVFKIDFNWGRMPL